MAWIFQNVDNNFFCKTKEKGRGNYFPLQMNKLIDKNKNNCNFKILKLEMHYIWSA